jgi:transcriptional regulator with XRE-family HTH domain
MYYYNMNFSEWLTTELATRGWSRSEAARRGNISPSMFDKVINGYSKPGSRFLEGIAQAFGISPIIVYRKAGLLPDVNTEKIAFDDWQDLLAQLSPEEQDEMRQIAIMKIERNRKAEKSARATNSKPKK